ncbi:MAG TPA: condensation domain-containing protein, partial [Nitrospirota bacterium]
NLPLVSVVEGDLDVAALDTAINAVVRRHRIFRATFAVDGSGKLVQRFPAWQLTPVAQVDLRTAQDGAPEELAAEQAMMEEIQKPFDLASGPPIRFRLFRIGERSYRFVITVHHIVFDHTTAELFADELAREYKAARSFKRDSEAAAGPDYAAFSAWQEQWIQSNECKKMEAAWRHYLEGADPSLNLPGRGPSVEGQTRPGTTAPIRLDQELLRQLRRFCRKTAVTPFLVLLTAWAVTLARLSGQKKLCVGVPLTNRRKEEFKNTMGCFVNILPLALDISDEPTMRETLSRVRKALLQMHRMQEIPYYHLVQLMRHKGMSAGNPLFQAGFTFENPIHIELDGVSVKPKYVHHGGAQLDLFAVFREDADTLEGGIEYDSSRFDSLTVKRIGESLPAFIRDVCLEEQRESGAVSSARSQDHPQDSPVLSGKRPLELSLLSAEERQRLTAWNETKTDYPADACIHQLVEKQADQTPESVAVEFEGKQLTYSELDSRSSQFAQHLQELGVGPEVLVALYVERSLEMVVALLGILKAGGAYLPLDRIFPKERLQFMLRDAKPQVLVTLKKLLGELPPHGATVVCVDAFPRTREPRAAGAGAHPSSSSLAYVLYTSGSTGKPKGVEISHRAVVNFLSSMRKEPGLNAHDILLSVTTISFDILGLELWLPLTTGAKVALVPPEVAMDGKQLAQAMERC